LIVQRKTKIRTDTFLRGDLLHSVDRAIKRRVLPEIWKAFSFQVTRRDSYKVSCYRASESGFFAQHRDNITPLVAHRRFALTLNLNDGFKGGGLCFPEYGPNYYRPAVGGAVVFSCALMHQALEVTDGDRFVLVNFFWGESDAAAGEAALKAAGSLASNDVRVSNH